VDSDLVAMRGFQKYRSCVDFLLEPLLSERTLVRMPCKHGRSFEYAKASWRQEADDQCVDDLPEADLNDHPGYCDCGEFNRRNELWSIGELCVKRSLTQNQLREMAAVMMMVTREAFTHNHVNRAMFDLFCGKHKDYLKSFKRHRDEGISFKDVLTQLEPKWQFRMMPNI
jgi:hypothetical protein